MDLGPEATHTDLVELGLPSTIADMTNPTEEYMLTLTKQFLSKLNIDVSAIMKPTSEQLCLSLAEDNPDMLSVINLSQAMASVCSEIFIKDFHLMDIMSPVPKRSRKTAKFLANYLLYATNKLAEIEKRMEVTRLKLQELQQLRNERMALQEAKNAQALRIAKKLEIKKQLEAEIEKRRTHKSKIKSKRDEGEKNLKSAEEEKLLVVQRHSNLTAQALKARNDVDKIKSKIVTSPERHNALLRDLLEQHKQVREKRDVLQEAWQSKQPSIQQLENGRSIVHQTHAKLREVSEVMKRFLESKKKLEGKQNEVADLESLIEEESNVGTDKVEQANTAALQAAKAEREEHLSALRQKQKELLTEKELLKKQIEESEVRLQEILSKGDEIRAATAKKETEMQKYLKDCQDLVDFEMKQFQGTKAEMERLLGMNLPKRD